MRNELHYYCPYKLEKAPTDAGYDLRYTGGIPMNLFPQVPVWVPTGLQIKWSEVSPAGAWGYADVRGRSGLFGKGILTHFGLIDHTFNSEIKVGMVNLRKDPFLINPGDRIAQIMFFPPPGYHAGVDHPADVILTRSQTPFEDNRGGFGSTGME